MTQSSALRPDVSLITVIYGEAELIGGCVASVQAAARYAGCELEVVLIDNKPGDGTAEAARKVAPDATVIENAENIGFARACNRGFEVATGEWWLLLNPDATLDERALARMLEFARGQGKAAAVAPNLAMPGRGKTVAGGMLPGVRSALGHFWLWNRLLLGDRGGPWRGFNLHRRDGLGPRRGEWFTGGALLLRPKAVQSIGGFDPSFFLYADDVDLGARLTGNGWELWWLPDAHGAHSVAATSGGVTDRWYVALHDYHARSTGRVALAVFDLVVGTGLVVRAIAARNPEHRQAMTVSAKAALGLGLRTAASGGRGLRQPR